MLALADHVFIEDLDDVLGRGNAVAGLDHRGFVFLADDVHAQLDAFIADEDGRSGDKLPDFVLALAAERTIQGVLGVTAVAAADFAHITFLPARRISKSKWRSTLCARLRHSMDWSLAGSGAPRGTERGPHTARATAATNSVESERYVIKSKHSVKAYY